MQGMLWVGRDGRKGIESGREATPLVALAARRQTELVPRQVFSAVGQFLPTPFPCLKIIRKFPVLP